MDWAGSLVNSRYDAIGRLASEVVQAARVGPTRATGSTPSSPIPCGAGSSSSR
jgi:hypothetical protein